MSSEPRQYVYPPAIYAAFARISNVSLGFRLINVDPPFFTINIPYEENRNQKLITRLLEKLAESITIINEKYNVNARSDILPEIRIDFKQTPDNNQIIIIGFELIPPSKMLGLLDLVVWHAITYVTGKKPSETPKGREMIDKWKQRKKAFVKYINSLPRERGIPPKNAKCAICGKDAVKEQIWYFQDLTGKHEIRTPVCVKHASKLI